MASAVAILSEVAFAGDEFTASSLVVSFDTQADRNKRGKISAKALNIFETPRFPWRIKLATIRAVDRVP
jgi:hypothetical protein